MTKDQTKPLSLSVTLSGGQKVTVQQITWDGWRKVKEKMLEALTASEVSRALSSLLSLWETKSLSENEPTSGEADDSQSPAASEDLEAGRSIMSAIANSDIAEHAPAALQILNRTLDEMTCDLLESCIDAEQPARLSAPDVMELRDAIFEVNDFAALLSAEKNSFAALLRGFQSTNTTM